MRILILVPYYIPESVGPAVWIEHIALDLMDKGHEVTVLTAFPHYPSGIVFDGYKRKVFQRETVNGVKVIRTWIYTVPDKSFWPRFFNWSSFCVTSFIGGLFAVGRTDVIYSILWPLPLGVTANFLGRIKRAKMIVNIQDIYPDIAIELGLLRSRRIIRFFQSMERWIYKRSSKIVVISQGFRVNLLSKGVPDRKIVIVPNWADASFIQPGSKETRFRRELHADHRFIVIYSGSLSHNSDLEPVLYAAELLKNEPFAFVLVGDGVHKGKLEQIAAELKLENVQFKPFQPLERYPEVLLSGDITLVTLNNQCSLASVPSKIFKQMAAGRPILAITSPNNEVDRMIREAECGLSVPPNDPNELVAALRWAEQHPDELLQMGINSRAYLERHHSREVCVEMIGKTIESVEELKR